MVRHADRLALAAVLLLATGLVLAARQVDRRLPARTAERRLALVIGNNAYPSAPLRNAVTDARAMAAALRDLGFDVAEQLDAGGTALETAVAAFGAGIRPDDVALFYYSGHGVQIDRVNYLIPVDVGFAGANDVDLKRRSYAADAVLEHMKAARVKVLILDACRDNPFSAARGPGRGWAGMDAQGALIAFATAPGSTASDNPSGANGLFTTHLLELLREPGLGAAELFRRVRQRVYEASAGRQVPYLEDGLIGDFTLAPSSAPVARASLVVRSEPSGATIFIDGELRGVAAPELIISGLVEGEHAVVARREGFAEAGQRVRLTSGSTPLVLTLTGTSGALKVTSTPADAQVIVDGIARGAAGGEIRDLAVGAHRVEVTARGYVPFYGNLDVKAGATTPVSVSLLPLGTRGPGETTGIVHVTSTPPGARVYLDGALVGETPLTLESVRSGPHKVRVSQEFRQDHESAVTVEPKAVARVDAALALLPAELTIVTDFNAGTLWIDNEQKGPVQPTQVLKMAAGRHRIRLQHPTAGDIVQDVEVGGGAQRVELRKAVYLGSITILSDVALDQLSVNGRPAPLPPATVKDVASGPAEVVARAGDRLAVRSVTVPAGDTVVIRLSADEVRAFANVPPSARPTLVGGRWARIPAGTFWMGCVPEDRECDSDGKPRHQVTLTKPFELMTTEVTLGMFRAYASVTRGSVPAQPDWNRLGQPVVNVTWDESRAFCTWVGGRLPTEAEWEYAARGGRDGLRYPWGSEAPVCQAGAANGAWFSACGQGTTNAASYAPDAYGLFDMAGNVSEWVSDWYASSYPGRAVSDPSGPSSGQARVVRGGSWGDGPRVLRASVRGWLAPGVRVVFFGVRCARDVFP